MGYRIGIDVGGTFTDFVAVNDAQQMCSGKTYTVLSDEAAGIFGGLEQIATYFAVPVSTLLAETNSIVLGTTVVTNTMLEFAGANIGLLTTKGFRDVIELRRGYKESLFDIRLPPPYPLVPREKRQGVGERIDYAGRIVIPLDEQEVRAAVAHLQRLEVEAIAVCLLFSFVNPVHERRVHEIIREMDANIFVSLSSEVLPQVREFERVSTTVVNAYTSPKLALYLEQLSARLVAEGFAGELLLMQSNGGMMDIPFARERGVEAVLSGPSGGVVAATFWGELSGYKNVITADMGGTSYDVCLIKDSTPEVGVDNWISRYRVAVPLIDIHTIGAGGGSIAWLDNAGALRVGPRSAGAKPGPACYGRGGTEPTVTDADVVKKFRQEIADWPKGIYTGCSLLDQDFRGNENLNVDVTIEVKDSEVVVDFTGSHPQSPGIINSVPGNTLSYVYGCFSAVCPEVPINSGFFRPIRVVLPEGSVVNPH